MAWLVRRNGVSALTVSACALVLAAWVCAAIGDEPPAGPSIERLPPVAPSVPSALVDPLASQRVVSDGQASLPNPAGYLGPPRFEGTALPPAVRNSFDAEPLPQAASQIPDAGAPWLDGSPGQSQAWMHEYASQVGSAHSGRWWQPDQPLSMPSQYMPWWDALVRNPLSHDRSPLHVGIATLSQEALRHSSYVQLVAVQPQIRETELIERTAKFDWRTYLETSLDDVNEPVGSTLTTGTNANRFKSRNWTVDAGVRQRNVYGGELDAYQRVGGEGDNSRFLTPNPQRTTRLELRYTQPLLRGAGRPYNESRVLLAQLQLDQSQDEVARELELHLVKVTEAYWELYRTRAEFFQRRKLLHQALGILANLEKRRGVDAVERQIYRARAAVANRQSEMVRAETRIRYWQSQLRLLVNDPALVQAAGREFAPTDSPLSAEVAISMTDSLQTALVNRPDISQAIRNVRGAAVELGVAEKDILPKLDLVASTYVAGLADETNSIRSFGDQFSMGRPTYSLGLQFEIPLGNRAARAAAERRQLEMNKALSRFRLTVEEALTSVEIAVREVETSYRELVSKFQAMQAAQKEADYLDDRWRVLPGVDDSAAQLLEELLDAQARVAEEEAAMVRAQVNYALALVRLKSETGTLLRVSGP